MPKTEIVSSRTPPRDASGGTTGGLRPPLAMCDENKADTNAKAKSKADSHTLTGRRLLSGPVCKQRTVYHSITQFALGLHPRSPIKRGLPSAQGRRLKAAFRSPCPQARMSCLEFPENGDSRFLSLGKS